jgi:hypothetical protein
MDKLFRFLIPVLGVLGGVLMIMTILDTDGGNACVSCAPVNSFLIYTYILFGVSIVAALIASVGGFLNDPQSLKNSLMSIGIIVVLFVISYVLASDEVLLSYPKGITPTMSKLSDTGLILFYMLFFGAIASIVYSSVAGNLKK